MCPWTNLSFFKATEQPSEDDWRLSRHMVVSSLPTATTAWPAGYILWYTTLHGEQLYMLTCIRFTVYYLKWYCLSSHKSFLEWQEYESFCNMLGLCRTHACNTEAVSTALRSITLIEITDFLMYTTTAFLVFSNYVLNNTGEAISWYAWCIYLRQGSKSIGPVSSSTVNTQ